MGSGRQVPMEAKQDLAERFEQFRHQLVDRILMAAALLALAYVPVLLWRVRDVGWHSQLQLHALIALGALVGVALLGRLPAPIKSAGLLLAIVALGLSGIFTLGMVGAGYWWCLQAAVLAATLYSIRAGVTLAVASAVLMAAVGYGFTTGLLIAPFDLNEYVKTPSAWSAFLVVMVFAPTSLLLAFGGYQATIKKLVVDVDAQRSRLIGLVGHDQLTGLPQRALAADRLDMALRHAKRADRKVALLFADLDGFKAVNDNHGHSAGDRLLQDVANRLRTSVREQDTVARVGGDEFIVILTDLADPAAACRVADEIIAQARKPIEWQGKTLAAGASIGIAIFPDHAQDPDALRRLADAAMYAAKRKGRNGWCLAEPPAAGDPIA